MIPQHLAAAKALDALATPGGTPAKPSGTPAKPIETPAKPVETPAASGTRAQ